MFLLEAFFLIHKNSGKIYKEEKWFKQIKGIFLLYCKYFKMSSRKKNI